MDVNDFLPNIKCPHCGKSLIAAISGFGGRLNNRKKVCKFCEKQFYVQILVETTTDEIIEDGKIRSMEAHIVWLNKQRENTYVDRLVKYEFAQKMNKEALEAAKEMRRKQSMN